MTNILELKNVKKSYTTSAGRLPVLKDINVAFKAGEATALVGQSGSGKSTFLHIAGLLDKPSSGQVLVEGAATQKMRDVSLAKVRNQTFGFVYQQHHLLKEFTVLENVLLPAQFSGVGSSVKNLARAEELLGRVGLSSRMGHLPGQLSGGEQQRCALARALMNKPKLLLADEPTGNLDAQTAAQITDLLFELAADEDLALLLVTHSEVLAKRCGRVLTLQDGVLG